MADVGKPIGRGPSFNPLQAKQGTARGGTARGGRKARADAQDTSNAVSRFESTADTLEAEPTAPSEHNQTTIAARGQRAAISLPAGKTLGTLPKLGMPPRAASTMPSAGLLGLQSAREHAPLVFTQAMSQVAQLRRNSAPLGTDANVRQEALSKMGKLLQQASLQHGFTETNAQQMLALAEVARVTDNAKIMAAADFIRPTTPLVAAQSNPFESINESREHELQHRLLAEQRTLLDQEQLKIATAEQANTARAKDDAKKADNLEQKMASRASETNAHVQAVRAQAQQLAQPPMSASAKIAQKQAAQQSAKASFRGHTVAQTQLPTVDLDAVKNGQKD